MWEELDQQHRGLLVSVSSFLIMLVFQPLLRNAISASRSICFLCWAVVSWLLDSDEDDDDEGEDHRSGIDCIIGMAPRRPGRRHCERCSQRGDDASFSGADVAAVVASLGLADDDEDTGEFVAAGVFEDDSGGESSCGGCVAMAAAEELTESKVASEAELREAFYVFDRDEDGFVTPAELWNVMRRLAMPEGARYDDCRRMIAAHDADGDGRVSFREFRAMMENAV